MDTFIIDSSKNNIQIGNSTNLVYMTNCSIQNLSGINSNLTNITSSFASIVNLSASNMSTYNFSVTNMKGINISNTNLTSITITAENVSNTNLTSANVSNTNLTSTTITAENVSNINLTSTKITADNVSNTNLTSTKITAENVSNTNLTATNTEISYLFGPSCTIPIGGIIMYSGVWPPKDASNNTPSGITNMFSSNRWILCDGGTATAPTFPTPLPNGVLSYAYTAPTTNVQGKIIIGVPNSTITLTIPDLRGRFVMGYIGTSNFAYSNTITSAQTTNQQLLAAQSNQTASTISGVANYPGGINNFGGVMTQVLANTEMPTHTHNMAAHTHGMQHKHNFQHVHGFQHTHTFPHKHGMQHTHEYSYTNANVVGEIGGGGGKQCAAPIAYSNDRDTGATRIDTDENTQATQNANRNETDGPTQQSTSDMYDIVNNQLVTSTQTPSVNDTFPTGGNSQGGTLGNTNPRSNLPPYWVLAYIMRIG